MNVKNPIAAITAAVDSRIAAGTTNMQGYRDGVARAEREAAIYKNEEQALANRKKPLLFTTRQCEKAADEALASVVNTELPKLKKELSRYLTTPADPALLSQLQVYADFNMKMSKGELEAFILRAEGNYTALRAIQTVAANSGFTVSIPEGFEEDLATIAKLGRVPSMYCPPEYLSEGMEVLPDIPHFADDGSVAYSANRPDSIYLLIQSGAFNAARRELANISEKWGTAFVPSISELKPIKDSVTGEVISTPEQQHTQAVEAAAETVDIRDTIKGLKADPNCQSILDLYI